VADAFAAQQHFARHRDFLEARARGDDDCARLPLTGHRIEQPAVCAGRDARDVDHLEVGAGSGSLLLHGRAEIVAGDPFREAGVAIDPFDAQQVAAQHMAGKDQGSVAEACSGESGGESGDAAPHHDDVVRVSQIGIQSESGF
jgi:hypothetical protein